MENQNIGATRRRVTPRTNTKNKLPLNRARRLLLVGNVLILLTAGSFGAYYWQHDEVHTLDRKVAQLQAQLATTIAAYRTLQQQVETAQSGTFTYSPRTAGLSFTLPNTYAVLVAADGNTGGAPSLMFRVVPASTSHISDDWGYSSEASVEASPGFTTLDQAVNGAEQRAMTAASCGPQNGTYAISDFSVSNTSVAGLPAKLIQANGLNEHLGRLNIYVLGAGQWTYTITINSMPNYGQASDLVAALLKGISIKNANYAL